MKIFLTDQSKNFHRYLEELKHKPVMPYVKGSLPEKTSTITIASGKALDQLNMDVLNNYRIFPGHIMSYLTQWQAENRRMRVGDTIVQQVYIPPVRSLSQKIIFGVRINGIIDEPTRKGFSYETLAGHVEKGISTFTVEANGDELLFKIHTCSAPGNLLTKMLGPIFSVPYQAYCTRQALKHVKRQLEAIPFEPFGNFSYHPGEKQWFGYFNGVCPGRLEIAIEANSSDEDIADKLELIRAFVADYKALEEALLMEVFRKYQGTEFEKTIEEIREMYDLSSITLQQDNRSWWLVLEPTHHAPSIYNNFLRFAMVDGNIVDQHVY